MKEFFDAMRKFLPEDSRILFCQFRGDPHDDIQGKWAAKVLNNPDAMDDFANVYLCVSAMKKHPRDGWKRRKENFAGGLLLMIDDVGSGAGSKFPLSHLDALQPTALIETSPSNFQAVYMFDGCITDESKFNALIDSFVKARFLDNDPGMKGVTRVFRPPYGINGKEKYKTDGKPFKVRLAEWHPENRYSYEHICEAFELQPIRKIERRVFTHSADLLDRTAAFKETYLLLKSAGYVKGQDDRDHEWIHISCPWKDGHTGGVDNGAGLTMPSEHNDWYGGFKCHHGSCSERGWRELTDYTVKIFEEILVMANDGALK
jgi:hypothetical protein